MGRTPLRPARVETQSPNSSFRHKCHMLAVSGKAGECLGMTETQKHNHAGSLGHLSFTDLCNRCLRPAQSGIGPGV